MTHASTVEVPPPWLRVHEPHPDGESPILPYYSKGNNYYNKNKSGSKSSDLYFVFPFLENFKYAFHLTFAMACEAGILTPIV